MEGIIARLHCVSLSSGKGFLPGKSAYEILVYYNDAIISLVRETTKEAYMRALWDLFIYILLIVIVVLVAFYISQTCWST